MSEDDLDYYRRRAETEFEQARQATCPAAMRAHSRMAEAYFARIATGQPARQAEGA